jgi:hypothetical protein
MLKSRLSIYALIRINRSAMSHEQLKQKLERVEKSLRKETLQVCGSVLTTSRASLKFLSQRLNTSKALRRLHVHRDTWRALLQLIGTHDVPGLHRIFKNAKTQNWSVEALLEKVQMALDGTYHPRSYSDLELELATTIYELGGGAALHALHHSPFAFPSRNTLAEHRDEFQLRITAGAPTMLDILANIETMFKNVQPGHKKVGITLSMDEIASDGRPCYLPATDEIAGLCEHAASELPSVKMGRDLDVMRAVAMAVRCGKVHVGKEVFVAAFARNDESDYGAKPVLLMPTCKQGSYKDSALIIEMLRQAWRMSPYGEALHGPVWSIASDGDPKRRPALYLHCMVRELTPSDPMFQHVGSLPGLNLYTGSAGETQDLDYKHDFKRRCCMFSIFCSYVDMI